MQTEAADGSEITKAIIAGAAAGSLRFWARQRPDCERGLLRAANEYTRKATAALDAVTKLGAPTPGFARGE